VPFFRLRDAEQRIDLGEDDLEGTTVPQCFEEDLRGIFAKRGLRLFPDPLADERIRFAALDDLRHQGDRLVGDREAMPGESRCKTRDPQDAHGIFDKVAVGIPRHGIDRQVAAPKVLLDRHLRIRMKGEAVIARTGFSFRPGEGVFLARIRVQEHREVFADRPVTELLQCFGFGAYDTPVPFRDRNAKQFVPNRATDKVNFHTMILSFATPPCRAS
jgi:hypothetical protein